MALTESAIGRIYAYCEGLQASDVHLSSAEPPRFRVQGNLETFAEFPAMDSESVDAIAMELGLTTLPIGCPDGTERVRKELFSRGSIDGAVTSPTGVRYRFNIFRENGGTAIALRRLESELKSLDELGLPARLADFCDLADGLVLVTGPAGSGKSTTLATLMDIINGTRRAHIVTVEDPVEYVHSSRLSLVHQRQIGRDARTFSEALVSALRQDPDVILLGEARDLDTIRTAITAAETGHLVFATMHAGDAAGAIERLAGVFPAEEQTSIRHQLALVLRGVIAQRLLPGSGSKRVAAVELLVNTTGVANLIATGRTAQICSALETGQSAGMIPLDAALADLVRRGEISESTAMASSHRPESFAKRLHQMRG